MCVERRYEVIDPIVETARSSQRLFQWDRRTLQLPSAPAAALFR
ncbi:hypothetical protein EB231_02845 [Mesorhizobium sp. NZP2298]|nr:hypothetical protein EB231_02845 [Mesorhizobium sp. NZP2298]